MSSLIEKGFVEEFEQSNRKKSKYKWYAITDTGKGYCKGIRDVKVDSPGVGGEQLISKTRDLAEYYGDILEFEKVESIYNMALSSLEKDSIDYKAIEIDKAINCNLWGKHDAAIAALEEIVSPLSTMEPVGAALMQLARVHVNLGIVHRTIGLKSKDMAEIDVSTGILEVVSKNKYNFSVLKPKLQDEVYAHANLELAINECMRYNECASVYNQKAYDFFLRKRQWGYVAGYHKGNGYLSYLNCDIEIAEENFEVATILRESSGSRARADRMSEEIRHGKDFIDEYYPIKRGRRKRR